ncbi:MAG: TlpA disulfide reductase family protein [Akkermansia sp.]|nr:TlpA disulfide reductase family protein [Akkermansia sp.]
MKHGTLFLTMILGLFATAMPNECYAQNEGDIPAQSPKKAKKDKKKEGVVAKALKKATYLTKTKPARDAKFYIFLESASWCGPCKAVMPKIVEQYPQMKEAGVELILVAQEPDEAAKKYLENYKAEFAGVGQGKLGVIPGRETGQGIPFMCMVDADGKTITSGHGRMVLQWRGLTGQAVPESDEPGAVAKALEETKCFNGKPNKKAKYYVYLHSSATCVACKSIIPTIVKEYKKMKRGKVEIILFSHDSTEEAAKAYVKSLRAKFPVVMDGDPAAKKLPGYAPVNGIPQAIIVDRDGNPVKEGHGNIVLEWKTLCP